MSAKSVLRFLARAAFGGSGEEAEAEGEDRGDELEDALLLLELELLAPPMLLPLPFAPPTGAACTLGPLLAVELDLEDRKFC